MKRWNLFVFCVVLSVSAFAQDIIITRDAKRIESKIQEVSPTEVRYKESDNLDGPVFVLPTRDITAITFQNGSVKVFDNVTPQRTQNSVTEEKKIDYIARVGNDEYILEQNGMKTQMDKEAYLRFIHSACPDAYDEYRKGTRMMGSGWGLLAGGVVTTLCLGMPLSLCCVDYSYDYVYDVDSRTNRYVYYSHYNEDMFVAGIAVMTIGSAAMTASVPLLCVGYHKMHNSHEVYNEQCAKRDGNISLNAQVSADGIGLALRF